METNLQQTSIRQLSKSYDAYLIDLWGVVYDGVTPYPGVVDSLNYLLSQNKIIIFLSNAPRPGTLLINKLIDLGIKITTDMILTSGDMIRQQLTHFNDDTFNNLGRCFYHLGSERNFDILSGLTVNLTQQIEEADFILSTAYLDEDEDLTQHDAFLNKAALLKVPMVCVNPDKIVVHGNKIRYCAGAIAQQYEQIGGIVYYYGKPYANIYEKAFRQLETKGIYDKKRILMIGDTLETDIAGAHNAQLDSALVLTGNIHLLFSEAKAKNDIISLSHFLLTQFKKTNITPTWILERFSIDE